MDREGCRGAWQRYYARLPRGQAILELGERTSHLEGRMRLIGRSPGSVYKGFVKARLTSALGMALGVQKQLQWGLTSVPLGGTLKGGGGARKDL